MKILIHVGVLFYLAVISFFCGIIFLFAGGKISVEDVARSLSFLDGNVQARLLLLMIAGVVLFFSILFARIISGGRQKEKTIAFDNPSGRVSISLHALEETVKKSVLKILEVKEIKPTIVASKKGIEINCRVILRSESRIPELTSCLQETIKERVQDVLGIEENVIVRIHIVRIVFELGKSKKISEEEGSQNKESMSVPFQGYRK
jgi:uncharacterized alkaline shock family protein YloU